MQEVQLRDDFDSVALATEKAKITVKTALDLRINAAKSSEAKHHLEQAKNRRFAALHDLEEIVTHRNTLIRQLAVFDALITQMLRPPHERDYTFMETEV